MTESFAPIIQLGHEHDLPVYPCIDWGFWTRWAFLDMAAGEHRTMGSRVKTLYYGDAAGAANPSYIVKFNSWPGTMAAWRAAATILFSDGADGVYTFNSFYATREIWDEIGSPETMANKDRVYGMDRFNGSFSLREISELELNEGEPVDLYFQVGEDLETTNASLRFRVHFWDIADGDDIKVNLNGSPLDDLEAAAPDQTATNGQWLECRLDPSRSKKGRNEVQCTVNRRGDSGSKPIVLDAVQLHFSYE